jgi:C-terminal processing protease CtpA/Prc
MRKLNRSLAPMIIAATLAFSISPLTASAQVSGNDRGIAFGMADTIKDTIKKNYYDQTFHGVDIDFVFEQAKERLKAAETRDSLMVTLASAVMAFDDSHTTFIPPSRAATIEYGWQVGMVGDDCFITHVKPGSDAETKGLKPGDKLLAIDNFKPTRKNLWQMYYRYYAIAPAAKVNMVIQSPGDSQQRTVAVQTKINKTGNLVSLQTFYDRGVVKKGWFDSKKLNEFAEFGDQLLVWKMHTFENTDQSIDFAMSKANKFKTLVIDLRGNGGGYVDALKRLVGHVFDKEIKICDQKMRKTTKPQIAKSLGNTFNGQILVLIDHDSASASELFARVMQLESRGKVLGDKSAGAVMESEFFDLQSGFGQDLFYGASVTIADLIMADGKSLEKVGVTPDETVLPIGKDLAENRDPVLSYAAKLAGVELSPEKAGALFPYEWPKQ